MGKIRILIRVDLKFKRAEKIRGANIVEERNRKGGGKSKRSESVASRRWM